MITKALCAIAFGAFALLTVGGTADAGERKLTRSHAYGGAEYVQRRYHRRGGPRVRGYVARRGGYSYNSSDVVNTYGQSRDLFGSANSYRNPYIGRQTPSGPFDHGFFFDSGIGPRGGDSPYLN
jgi:hypothetical protein